MADLGQINVNIGADTKRLEQGLQKSKGELKEFEGKVSTGAAKMALFTGAAIAGAAALRGLGQFIASSVRLSADLAETQSKFNTVFDASSAKVDKLASSFGILSKGEAQGFLATTGAILRGAGLAGEEVDNLASQVGELARDFSSFNNVPVAETFNAINAAITGEREQLKRLGIVLNEADVQQRALADSGKRAAKELTQQEKAVATLALIAQKANVQVGDFARTSDSAANQSKQLQTNVQNLQEAFAGALEPAVREVVTRLNAFASNPSYVKSMEDFGKSVGDAALAMVEFGEVTVKALGAAEKGANALGVNTSVSDWVESTKKDFKGLVRVIDAVLDAFAAVSGQTRQIPSYFDLIFGGNESQGATVPRPLTSRDVAGLSPGSTVPTPTTPTTPITPTADPTRKLTLANTLELLSAQERYLAGLGVSQSNAAALTKELVDTVTNQEIAAGLAELTGENMALIASEVDNIDLDRVLEGLGQMNVGLTQTQELVSGAFAQGITEVFAIMTDGTKAMVDRLAAVGDAVRNLIVDLGKALLQAELLDLIRKGSYNPIALFGGLGLLLGGGLLGRRSNPQVNRSITGRPVASPSSQLVASMGIDQIHFALERYKSENFLA